MFILSHDETQLLNLDNMSYFVIEHGSIALYREKGKDRLMSWRFATPSALQMSWEVLVESLRPIKLLSAQGLYPQRDIKSS